MFRTGLNILLRPTRYMATNPCTALLSTQADPRTHENIGAFKRLWPIYKEMEMFVAAHELGARQTGGAFTYNTAQPLNPDHVELALRHLQRKIPNFRTFVKEFDGQLWACEDLNPDIDFEYLEGVETREILHQFSNDPIYGDRSPTWKTRLVKAPADAPCHLPEVKARFPYQYDLTILNHHAFIDGFTMAFVTGQLVNLLNDVIAGRPIDDKPLGVLMNNEEIVNIDAQIAKELTSDPESLEKMKEEILACDRTPVLFQAFPPPGGRPGTNHVHRIVNQKDLATFTAQCKANGVTFNSGMEALINTAIMEMVRDAGVSLESQDLSINLATDLRRYMERRPFPVLGLHVRPTVHRIHTPSNVRDNFWEYTKVLNQRLSLLLKSGEAVKQSVVRDLTLPAVSAKEYFASEHSPIRDYGLSNIGDLTRIIPGVGDHLQQTNLTMYTAAHHSIFMMLHQLYTLRGISPYSISYDTSYMANDTAEMLIDRIMGLLKELGASS